VADFPRDKFNMVSKETLAKPKEHIGFLGHYHASSNKVDPIVFDFDRFLKGVAGNNPNEPSSYLVLDTWAQRQECLKSWGLLENVSGVLDVATVAVIKDIQKQHKLAPTGEWSQHLEFIFNRIS
jgi:hypothetical protein